MKNNKQDQIVQSKEENTNEEVISSDTINIVSSDCIDTPELRIPKSQLYTDKTLTGILTLLDRDGDLDISVEMNDTLDLSSVKSLGEEQNWELVDCVDNTDNRQYTFRTDDGISIAFDPTTYVNGELLNNIIIRSPIIDFTNTEEYVTIYHEIVEKRGLDIRLRSSGAFLEKLIINSRTDVNSPSPKPANLINPVDDVDSDGVFTTEENIGSNPLEVPDRKGIQIVYSDTTLFTTKQEIINTVDEISEAVQIVRNICS